MGGKLLTICLCSKLDQDPAACEDCPLRPELWMGSTGGDPEKEAAHGN